MFRHVFCKTDFWLVPCLYMKEWVWSEFSYHGRPYSQRDLSRLEVVSRAGSICGCVEARRDSNLHAVDLSVVCWRSGFLLSVMETSTVEQSHWDSLPPEIKDYIEELAARQLHRERLKEVRHTFWIKTLSVHVPAQASELFFLCVGPYPIKKRMVSMASLELSRLQGI